MRSPQALRVAGRSLPRIPCFQSSLPPLSTAALYPVVTSRSCGSKKSLPRTAPRWRGDHSSGLRRFSTDRDGFDHEETPAGQGKDAGVAGDDADEGGNILAEPFGFAFDIDGVLMHTSTPIPGAGEALRYLHSQRIPFILLTNGGGKLESERARDLSRALDVPISEAQLVQSHTPWRQLVEPDGARGKHAEGLADKTILVTGSDPGRCREIAENYGFKSVVTPADILVAQPSIWPFEPLLGPATARSVRPLPRPIYTPSGGVAKEDCLRIHGIFIYNDPRDWAFDLQLITDLVTSEKGILGTKLSDGMQTQSLHSGEDNGQPDVYFSNRDVLWSTEHHTPRFGQGAFAAAALGIWGWLPGAQGVRVRSWGKPSPAIFQFAEHRLIERQRHLDFNPGMRRRAPRLHNVYMVGDNVISDIAGANSFDSQRTASTSHGKERGPRWRSILVRTGLSGNKPQWQTSEASPMDMDQPEFEAARYVPGAAVKDVKEAVRWALQREAWPGDF